MYLARTRFLFFLASLACASIIGVAFYLQQAVGLDPCALCMVQRAAFIVCGVLALCAACHAPGPKGTRRYSLALLVVALAGLSTAGTQVWLQTASADQLIPVITRLEHVLSLLSLDMCIDRLRSDALFCAEITDTVRYQPAGVEFAGFYGAGAVAAVSPFQRIQPLAGDQRSGQLLNACMNFISCVP